MKRVQLEPWASLDKHCLTAAVLKVGDQNWSAVSRATSKLYEDITKRRPDGDRRPVEWFSTKQCAAQYEHLLKALSSRRKKRNERGGDQILTSESPAKVLYQSCLQEYVDYEKKKVAEYQVELKRLLQMYEDVISGEYDDRLDEMLAEYEAKEREKEIKQKLKFKIGERSSVENTATNVDPSDCLTSPAPPSADLLATPPKTTNKELGTELPKTSITTSPLLTSLLQSPSPLTRPSSVTPTISLLLNSSPPVPSNESPTLSKLLESSSPAGTPSSSTSNASSQLHHHQATTARVLQSPTSRPPQHRVATMSLSSALADHHCLIAPDNHNSAAATAAVPVAETDSKSMSVPPPINNVTEPVTIEATPVVVDSSSTEVVEEVIPETTSQTTDKEDSTIHVSQDRDLNKPSDTQNESSNKVIPMEADAVEAVSDKVEQVEMRVVTETVSGEESIVDEPSATAGKVAPCVSEPEKAVPVAVDQRIDTSVLTSDAAKLMETDSNNQPSISMPAIVPVAEPVDAEVENEKSDNVTAAETSPKLSDQCELVHSEVEVEENAATVECPVDEESGPKSDTSGGIQVENSSGKEPTEEASGCNASSDVGNETKSLVDSSGISEEKISAHDIQSSSESLETPSSIEPTGESHCQKPANPLKDEQKENRLTAGHILSAKSSECVDNCNAESSEDKTPVPNKDKKVIEGDSSEAMESNGGSCTSSVDISLDNKTSVETSVEATGVSKTKLPETSLIPDVNDSVTVASGECESENCDVSSKTTNVSKNVPTLKLEGKPVEALPTEHPEKESMLAGSVDNILTPISQQSDDSNRMSSPLEKMFIMQHQPVVVVKRTAVVEETPSTTQSPADPMSPSSEEFEVIRQDDVVPEVSDALPVESENDESTQGTKDETDDVTSVPESQFDDEEETLDRDYIPKRLVTIEPEDGTVSTENTSDSCGDKLSLVEESEISGGEEKTDDGDIFPQTRSRKSSTDWQMKRAGTTEKSLLKTLQVEKLSSSSLMLKRGRGRPPKTLNEKALLEMRPLTPSSSSDGKEEIQNRCRPKKRSTNVSESSIPCSPSPSNVSNEDDKEYRAWKKSILLVYERIVVHKYASIFMKPISEDDAPGYSKVILKPRDLTAIKKQIESGIIRTTAEFQRELMQMLGNALVYNNIDSLVYKMASEMMQDVKEAMATVVQALGSGVSLDQTETRPSTTVRVSRASTSGKGTSGESTTTPPVKRKRLTTGSKRKRSDAS